MPAVAVYLVKPSRSAWIAASLMCSGVSKSGSPADSPATSFPAAARAFARAFRARVGDGWISARRRASFMGPTGTSPDRRDSSGPPGPPPRSPRLVPVVGRGGYSRSPSAHRRRSCRPFSLEGPLCRRALGDGPRPAASRRWHRRNDSAVGPTAVRGGAGEPRPSATSCAGRGALDCGGLDRRDGCGLPQPLDRPDPPGRRSWQRHVGLPGRSCPRAARSRLADGAAAAPSSARAHRRTYRFASSLARERSARTRTAMLEAGDPLSRLSRVREQLLVDGRRGARVGPATAPIQLSMGTKTGIRSPGGAMVGNPA